MIKGGAVASAWVAALSAVTAPRAGAAVTRSPALAGGAAAAGVAAVPLAWSSPEQCLMHVPSAGGWP